MGGGVIVCFFSIWPLRLLGLVPLQGFHAIVGMVLFFSISGLCVRWSLCFYMSFIVGMVLFLFYLAFAPAGTRAFAGVSSILGMVLFSSISGLCVRWSLCFYMSFIVGMVLFLFYLAFAPAGTRAFAGVSCYVRPLRLVELVFSHGFHRWDGVVFSSPAVAPAGTGALSYVYFADCFSPVVLCSCVFPNLFFQRFSKRFSADVSGRIGFHRFLCEYFHRSFLPDFQLQFGFCYLTGPPAALVRLHGFHALLFTVSSKLFCSGGFLPLFSSGVVCPDVSPNVSVQMFFRRFFVHKFLCQYVHRRFRSRTFLANVFFSFFLSRSSLRMASSKPFFR